MAEVKLGTWKQCTRCRRKLQLNKFAVRLKGKHGKDSRCYRCKKEIGAERKEKDPERARELSRKHWQTYYHKDAEASRQRLRNWRAKNPLKNWKVGFKSHLKTTYGITIEEYLEKLDVQGGVCAICHTVNVTGRTLSVDHDHQTGNLRGLLCDLCNTGLGSFRDSRFLLAAASGYLSEHEVPKAKTET